MFTNRRRNFLQSLLSLIGGFGLSGFSKTFPTLLHEAMNEEDFWRLVRLQFPLTTATSYLNTGTVGVSPYAVIEAVKKLMDRHETYGEYAGWETARQSIATLLNTQKEEIVLTHNTTEGINIVAAGLPLKTGDEVIMCSHEHVGNALPWLHQSALKGFKIKVFSPADTAEENLNRINELITQQTRVIALPHVTCTTGLVFPIAAIVQLAKSKNILTCIDAAQAVGAMPIDLTALGCDFYAACGHKWLFAPKGTGFLFVRQTQMDVLKPMFVGSYADIGWELTPENQRIKGYATDAHRYDYGTQNAPLWAGMQAAIHFVTTIGLQKINTHNQLLADYLQAQLLQKPHVEVLTPTQPTSKASIITFKLKNMPYRDWIKKADEHKIRARAVAEAQLDAIRISVHLYNTQEEIDKLLSLV